MIQITKQNIREIISIQKKNKDRDLYEKIEFTFFINSKKCTICGKSIFYYNSFFHYGRNNEIKKAGKSDLTTKIINNNTYFLKVCESCLEEKFGDKYTSKNRGRIFNMINDITFYAFQIPEEEQKKIKSYFGSGITKEGFIIKYGIIDGELKWNIYRNKQSYSNSFEYFSKTKGWSREQFENYNKSRGVTYDHLVKKHGLNKGEKIWNNYVKRQSYAGNKLEYFIEKYGLEKGTLKYKEVNKSKAINIKHYIKKFGIEEGTKKYYERLSKLKINYSKISQSIFKEIDERLKLYNFKTYYKEKNKEYAKLLSDDKYIFLDYYISELKLAIEFNGDCFHANPTIYKENDHPNPLAKKLTSIDIWKQDENRMKLLKSNFDIDTIVIWEFDYRKGKILIDDIVNNILSFTYKNKQ